MLNEDIAECILLNIGDFWTNHQLPLTVASYLCIYIKLCEWACDNQPCECKLQRVIFLLISLPLNVVFHFCKFKKKAHEILQ